MEPQVIANQLYYHYSTLKNWYKNEETRLETEANWDKSIASIQQEGIIIPFVIDTDNTVYDGNGRLLAIRHLIKQGINKAKNGKDLAWIPVKVEKPTNEEDKWKLALLANARYRSWNKETLSNYENEWENLDISLINIDFGDPVSLDDQIILADMETKVIDPPPTHDTKDTTCPNCGYNLDSTNK